MSDPARQDAPRARRVPHLVPSPHGGREDPYYWLRDDDRREPEVLAYLRAENDYFEAGRRPRAALEDALYGEIRARVKEDDASVPVFENGYWYETRYETGREYAQYLRRAPGAAAELLIDANLAAAGHEYYELGNFELSEDNRVLAIAEDTVGRRAYEIRFRDLAGGREYPERLTNAEADLAFADDPTLLLYVAKDPVTLLGKRVMLHRLGTPQSEDRLLYEQSDESLYTSVYRGRSRRLLYIAAHGTLTGEYRYARASDPALDFRLVLAARHGHEYQVEDLDERFIIRSNLDAPDFRICEVSIAEAGDTGAWRDRVPHRPGVFIDDCLVLRTHLAVAERIHGLRRIRLIAWAGGELSVPAEEEASSLWLGDNPEIDSASLRYVYSSLVTPATTYDYELATGAKVLRKREPLAVPYDPGCYRCEFIEIRARDGADIPVSLLYRVDAAGPLPLYQYAYGAYGLSLDPGFSSSRLSLVDRGFLYAIAHVRGGQELGRAWYDGGRLGAKMHSFLDFIDVSRALVAGGRADPAWLFGAGGSAGGLLIAAVANLAGDEYRALVAHVPFVDVVTTMLDESIPLTSNEYDEWGDPREPEDYRTLLSYAPYDNVSAKDYPALLVTTSLHDSQVQYWEPAKWVARLRSLKTDDRPLYLHSNLEAGHGGKSGRFERLREIAEEYAFILAEAGAPPLFGSTP
jgi:oligopeptidase B